MIAIQYIYIKRIVGIAILIAALTGLAMMYIALQHNPMGEYCEWPDAPNVDNCVIQWGKLFFLGSTWFFAAFIVVSLILALANVVFNLIYKRK